MSKKFVFSLISLIQFYLIFSLALRNPLLISLSSFSFSFTLLLFKMIVRLFVCFFRKNQKSTEVSPESWNLGVVAFSSMGALLLALKSFFSLSSFINYCLWKTKEKLVNRKILFSKSYIFRVTLY